MIPSIEDVEVKLRCPQCETVAPPIVQQRVSTGGWIVFAAMLLFFFPMCWVGLLIKEDLRLCKECGGKFA